MLILIFLLNYYRLKRCFQKKKKKSTLVVISAAAPHHTKPERFLGLCALNQTSVCKRCHKGLS